jgi:AraC-like DNA-binding protein
MPAALFQPFPMASDRRAQVWRHQPQFRRPRHFHEEPELNLVVKGRGLVGVGDRVLQVESGDVVLFHGGQDHVLLDASNDFDLFVMALRPELAARAQTLPSLVATPSCRLSPRELSTLTERLSALGSLRDATATEETLTDLFRTASARLSAGHVLSRRALECVRARPSMSGSALAAELRTGLSGMSRRFHRDLGVRFVDYRARVRLMSFVRLVDQGQTFTRAALEADFGSYAQCHRVFQRMLGCAPQEYFGGARTRVNDITFSPTAVSDPASTVP